MGLRPRFLVRITTIRHGYERIEQQGHGLKYESLSSGISSEGLSVLLLSSVLGYKSLQDPTNCSPSSPRGFLTLYIPLQSILALHLLIMQVSTRVLVPSATFPNP